MIEENYIYLGKLHGKLTKKGANVCVSHKNFPIYRKGAPFVTLIFKHNSHTHKLWSPPF